MALQATEQQGSRPPASDADTDPARRPVAFGGMGGSKRAAVAGMPDDALVEILSRLPAKFLCRSKCVSKAWCDLIVDRLRCRKLPLTLQGFFYGCVYESRNEDRDVLFRDSSDESGSEGNGEDGGGECKGDKSNSSRWSKFDSLYKAIEGGVKIFSSLKHNLLQQSPYTPSQ